MITELRRKVKKIKKTMTVKDELSRRMMKEFVVLTPKKYSYLTDDGVIDKKSKSKKRCVVR